MTRLRRIALAVLVGVLVALPAAGSALANTEAPPGSTEPTSSVILTASLGD